MIKKSIVLTGLLCCLSFGYCYAEDVRPNNQDSLDKKIKQANEQAVVSNDEDKNNSEEPIPTEGTRNWHIIVLIIVGDVILLAGIVAGVYYCYKKVTAFIKECKSVKGELEEIKEQNEKQNDAHTEVLNRLEKKIDRLNADNNKLINAGNINVIDSPKSVNKRNEVEYGYLKILSTGVSSGVFQKVEDRYDSECYFRFKKTNSNTARYEYYHEESASIVMDSEKYGSYVRGAVDVVERSSHKNKIETVEAGTIEYINGKWQIKNKAKIKIS